MLYHLTLNMPADTMPFQGFLLNGYLWVDLFFVLSGFVMAYSQAPFFQRGYRIRLHLSFLISRLARIYPLYALVIVESALGTAWRLDHTELASLGRTLVLNLTLVQAWGLAISLEGAAWSISTEWGAYLLFPALLAVTVLRSRWAAGISGLLALSGVVFLAMSPGPFGFDWQNRTGPLDIYSSATAAPLLRCVAEFALGLFAYRIWIELTHRGFVFGGWAASVVSILLAIVMSLSGFDVLIVLLFVALLVSLASQVGMLSTLLSGRVPYVLGQWSYSIYLIHDKFSHPAALLQTRLKAGNVPLPSVVAGTVICALVIALGGMSFYFVERPLRRWLMKFRQELGGATLVTRAAQ